MNHEQLWELELGFLLEGATVRTQPSTAIAISPYNMD
jgi:hypothetical protein